MKLKLSKIDKFSGVPIIILVIGILSSYFDFGIISVFFSVTLPIIFVITSALAVYGIIYKKYTNLIAVILFLLCYNFFFQFSANTDKNAKDSISVLSYNVRSFTQPINTKLKTNANTEINKLVDSLSPDILLLQESAYKEVLKTTGYPYIFMGYRENIRKSLLTIYSKFPIINEGYIDFPNTINNAIFADIKIQQDTIRIYNTHLQSFVFTPHIIANKYNDYSYLRNLNNTISKQIEQAKLIRNHTDKLNGKFIICGDFNATPFSKPYRILKKGLNDSYVSNGNGFGATYTRLHYPLRLDYFLNDEQIKVINHNNFDLNFSDHEPILIKFIIK